MEKKFTTENFDAEVLKADKPVLVDFYADWCGPCKMMAPVVEQLAGELDGFAYVGKLNVDENEEIAMRYKVMSIPTLIVFKNGEAVGKLVGVQAKDDIVRLVKNA
ncbi:MAG: thioredoxin [Eubacteriales bacterium]|nr:thioredoxin [Eubacteriales bacterium]